VRLLIAKRCKDKGISVGENTSINLNEIIVDNVDIGIASKDSSKAYLDKSKIMNSKICYSAYKKKQEFNGGYLAIENSSCRNSLNIFENDDYSKVDIYN